MKRRELIAAIDQILLAEERYAVRLQERGDMGMAKLAWAALGGIRQALKTTATGDDETYAERLGAALAEQRLDYLRYWDDDDGIGTSTFARVLNLLEDGI